MKRRINQLIRYVVHKILVSIMQAYASAMYLLNHLVDDGTILKILPSLMDKTYRKPSFGPVFRSLIAPKPVPNVTADSWLSLSTTKPDNPASGFIPVLV